MRITKLTQPVLCSVWIVERSWSDGSSDIESVRVDLSAAERYVASNRVLDDGSTWTITEHEVKLSGIIISIAAVIAGLMFVLPLYGVWTAKLDGEASLARAESTRQAQIIDAEAKLQSAKYIGQAADEIQSKLTPEYLEYLRIQMLLEVGEKNGSAVFFDASPSIVTNTKTNQQPSR